MSHYSTPAIPTMIVIEDHALVRAAIARLLRSEFPGWDSIEMSSVENIDSALGMDVRVVALYMGTRSIEDPVLRNDLATVQETFPQAEIALLSNSDDPRVAVQALRLGVRGFFTTSLSLDVALAGVRLVLAGGVYCPHPMGALIETPMVLDTFVNGKTYASANIDVLEIVSGFTHREEDVLAQLQLGHSNKIIAAELNMSENTVKMHIQHIMRKLRVQNRTEVVIQLGKRAAQDTHMGLR
jgi:DNA-binding NarL/FixJ family response regulator